MQKKIKGRFNNKSVVISPFVNYNLFKPGKRNHLNSKIKLLFVGNVKNKNKGFDILFKACSNLKNVQFELHIATQAGVDSKLKKTRIDLKIHKPKNDKELSAIYKHCDVFFSLSKEEGFGLTLLEAMASGLVCVATDSGGVNEFALNNKNCLIVERNYKDVAKIIEKINNNLKSFKKCLVPEAVKTASSYTEKKMVDSFEKFFINMKN